MWSIIDFVKSWFYYPTLKKWVDENGYGGFKDNRFEYSIKHCRMKKKIEESKESDNLSEWKHYYNQEPITSIIKERYE